MNLGFIDDLLKDCNQTEIYFDEKMWDWITLFHFDVVFSTSMTVILSIDIF